MVTLAVLTFLYTTVAGQQSFPESTNKKTNPGITAKNSGGTTGKRIAPDDSATTIRVSQQALTEDYRLVIQTPLIINLPVVFPSGSAAIPPAVTPDLERIADFLNWRQDTRLEIIGYVHESQLSKTRFSDIRALSTARADSIRTWIERKTDQASKRIQSAGGGSIENAATVMTIDTNFTHTLLVFKFIKAEKITGLQNMQLRITISVPEHINLQQMRLHSVIPSGWTYQSNSGTINGQLFEPPEILQNELVWDLTAFRNVDPIVLDLSVLPENHRQITSISVFNSYLEFIDPQKKHVITDTLVTRVPTRVNETTFRIIVPGATFEVNRWDITPEIQQYLAHMGQFLRWQEDIDITIEGYTDNTGTYETNLELSEKRAHSVKEYLREAYRLAPDRIRIKGMGSQFPTASNATTAGRAENRRIEFLVNSDFQQNTSNVPVLLNDSLIHTIPVTVRKQDVAPLTGSEIVIIPIPGLVQNIAPDIQHRVAFTIHTEMTTGNIGITPALEKITSVIDSLGLADTGCITDSCILGISRTLGATHILSWSLSKEDEQYRMLLRYIDVSDEWKVIQENSIQFSGDEGLEVVVRKAVQEVLSLPQPAEKQQKFQLKRTHLIGGIVIILVGAGVAIAVSGPGPEAPPAGIGLPPDWPEP
ncbi:MAG: OmpA family protein [Fidelibacterota bacterium]